MFFPFSPSRFYRSTTRCVEGLSAFPGLCWVWRGPQKHTDRQQSPLWTPLGRRWSLLTSLSCLVTSKSRHTAVFMSPHFAVEEAEAERIGQGASGRSSGALVTSMCSHALNDPAAWLGRAVGSKRSRKPHGPRPVASWEVRHMWGWRRVGKREGVVAGPSRSGDVPVVGRGSLGGAKRPDWGAEK